MDMAVARLDDETADGPRAKLNDRWQRSAIKG